MLSGGDVVQFQQHRCRPTAHTPRRFPERRPIDRTYLSTALLWDAAVAEVVQSDTAGSQEGQQLYAGSQGLLR